MQLLCTVERARVRHLARHPEVNLNLLTMVDILNKSPDQALHYSPALIPFKEQIIVQQGNFQGSEGQHRRPQMCILESP